MSRLSELLGDAGEVEQICEWQGFMKGPDGEPVVVGLTRVTTRRTRTATGKSQKFKLREPYWVGYERRIN